MPGDKTLLSNTSFPTAAGRTLGGSGKPRRKGLMSFLWSVMDLSTMVERDTSAGLGQLFSQEGTEQSNQGSLLLFFHASISYLNLKVS